MGTAFEYPECRLVAGDPAAFAAARARFDAQPVDDTRFADHSGWNANRTTIAGEVSESGVGTFRGSEKRTITFAPSARPGWWIRRTDLPEQLDTAVDIVNLWTSARNLVLRSGSPHNYLRMSEHIIAHRLGMNLDNVVVSTSTGDPPLFDVGSMPIVDAIRKVGVVKQDAAPLRYRTVR